MDSGNFQLPSKVHSLDDLINTLPCNPTIGDNFIKAWSIVNSPKYEKICCFISGGSDSDIVLDICIKVDIHHKITYIFIDTGLESKATKEHIKYLEDRYGIKIIVYKSYEYGMSIPISCKKYGQPFVSKIASENIMRLQRHNFKWEDKPFDVLYEEYPHCKSALMWWCNEKKSDVNNIRRNKWLKEFLIANPPTFKISNKCCDKSKKDVSKKVLKELKCDLKIIGVRKYEGGARATAYKNCYTNGGKDIDEYRPIFWYTNDDKKCYERHYGIVHSRCYSQYGLKRTGCCGCPFGRSIKDELEALNKYEPNLHKAACNVFRDSYEYTRKYNEFRKQMESKTEENNQITIFDFI